MSRKWMAVMVLAVSGAAPMAALTGLLPATAQAACSQWDASGDITLHQANGATPFFTLQQNGSELHGSATYGITTPECVERANCAQIGGEVTGSIKGDSFEVTARWDNGSVGVYRGGVDANGAMEGATYDRSHPESASSWYSERPLNCAGPPPLKGSPGPPRVKPQLVECQKSQCLECVDYWSYPFECIRCGPIPNCEPPITNQRRSSGVLVPEPPSGPGPPQPPPATEPPPAIESVPKPSEGTGNLFKQMKP